jgi:hypothetical protein
MGLLGRAQDRRTTSFSPLVERGSPRAGSMGTDDVVAAVDWTALSDDRASMAGACGAWRALGSSPCLWSSLDLRAHRCDLEVASSLASRCVSLWRMRLRGYEAVAAIPGLRARGLCEVAVEGYRALTDTTLAVLAT